MSYIGKGVEVVTFNTATTLDVAGNITVGGTVDGRDVATDGTKLDTIAANAIANLSEDTTPQLGGNLDLNTSNVIGTGNINVTGSITGTSFVSTGDMSFTNNSKAIFGTSPSLEIYHDGSNSILDDVGAGNFKMQLAGADKLEITSTGVDVTGTVKADELYIQSTSNDSTVNTIQLAPSTTTNVQGGLGVKSGGIIDVNGVNSVGLQVGGTRFVNVVSGGDISFYDSTGVTQGFFWDASAQSLGIGTTSPDSNHKLEVAGSGTAEAGIRSGDSSEAILNFGRTSDRLRGRITYNNSSEYMAFWANQGEKMRIDSSGNVGIGTSSPTSKLSVVSGTNAGITVNDGTVNTILFNTSSANGSVGTTTNHPMAFYSNNTERMRIDSSGQLIVGHTGAGSPYFNEGIVLNPAGDSVFHRDGNSVVDFSRQTSDGNIVRFVKDNSVVGSIGSRDGFVTIYNGDTGIGFDAANDHIRPVTSTGSRDAAIDLGRSSTRFKNLYLSGSISDGTNSKTVADIVSGGGGGLIQTVSTHHVTSTTISGTAFTQYGGLNTSITPTSSSNKVLVTVHINMSAVGDSFPAFRIYRGGTWIGQSNTVSPGIETTFAHAVPTGGASATVQMGVASFTFLDSPSTTSATTYSVYISPMRTTSRTLRINESYSRGDDNQYSGGSTMILMEVT